MIAQHLNHQRHDWKHLLDYETLWILAFSAVVIGSGIFALFSMAQSNPHALL
jgi:ABC-type Fe3+ transport system permease subunit